MVDAEAEKFPRSHEFEWQQSKKKSCGNEYSFSFVCGGASAETDWIGSTTGGRPDTWQINSRFFSSTKLLVSISESHEVYSQDN